MILIGSAAYPSYQVFLASGVAALLTGILMPPFIRLMKHEGLGQQVRADGPKRHLIKQGTPTMGGIIILAGIIITTILMAPGSPKLALAIFGMIATGALGLLDDIESVAHKRSLGLTPSQKMIGLTIICAIFGIVAVNVCGIAPTIEFPGGATIDLGVLTTTINGVHIPWLYLIFLFLLLAGFSNAVNLTDGLDGLAGGTVLVVMVVMAMVAFNEDELGLAVFAASIAGACVGFLWHNCYPASIFMGDTGSLALGGAFASLAILTKTEICSLVMGGLFIVEALSVIIQVVSFKTRGKR
ncbi:MAG: phospho-N-acetylmuramoyl-pentapeptide-transferase, partial [Atopobiaceae bacterium]|nr:phospho-N-acetylmuramoyl-pentapeptide-transferase [Atopobiaceae bacterium]